LGFGGEAAEMLCSSMEDGSTEKTSMVVTDSMDPVKEWEAKK
jgi:hypothetical protein